jgi:hypothetical protein
VILRATAVALLFLSGVLGAQSNAIIRLDDPGTGRGPGLLQRILAGPYRVIGPGADQVNLHRDSTYQGTIIILGRDGAVDGTVAGDVVVIGGDLYIHPRSSVTRGIAIGGGVYESTMARVTSIEAFRDFTYDISEIPGGYSLRYRSLIDRPQSTLTWPGIYGFRIPSYDRTNGLSAPFGPLIAIPGTGFVLEPRVTYRSQLGAIDPSITASHTLDSRTAVAATVARSTYTNEAWIWPDLMNSAAVIFGGNDTRNYYRATRAQASLSRRWETPTVTVVPYAGARWERAASVRPDSGATGGPWSFRGRRDVDDMLRPNPPIDAGSISSVLAGGQLDWSDQGVDARANLDAEVGAFSRSVVGARRALAQLTFDGTISFPTFGLHTLRMDGHAVVSLTGSTPRQRWAYVGGSGSVSTLEMLERGGDQLVFVEGRYTIPITRIMLPLVGAPTVTVRQIFAGADVRRWPSLAQATGVRVSASVVYVDFLIDPTSGRRKFGIGLSLVR